MTTAHKKSRSGPNIPEEQRGTPRLQTRVTRDVLAAYEREAQARGLSLAALVRERLESAPWCDTAAETEARAELAAARKRAKGRK
jgi:hypothetical protein